MGLTYKPLWKLLIDRGLSRSEMRVQSGISTRALAKLGRDEDVNTDVLRKICAFLQCDISDIVEITREPHHQEEIRGV